MDNLTIQGTRQTPSVDLNLNTGILKLFGRSTHENPIKFYEPINSWVEEFFKTNPEKIILQLHFDYLNTLSTKDVLALMKKLEIYSKSSKSAIKIIWNFDENDEDMKDLGIDFSTVIDLPFDHIEVLNEN